MSNRGQWVRSPRTHERVGLLMRENGVTIFQRLVRESVHKLRNCNGWGVEIDLLGQLERLGADWLRIITSDTNRVMCAPLRLFRERGQTIGFSYGVQLALLERYFVDSIGADVDLPNDFPQDHATVHEEPAQGSLFGGECDAA